MKIGIKNIVEIVEKVIINIIINIIIEFIIKMIIENRRIYVSECNGEPPSITPPAPSKRLDSPRPFPAGFPHTS